VVSAAELAQGTRRSGDRCAAEVGGNEATVGLLEALSATASAWTSVEPQASASRVLRSEAEFTEADEAAIAEEDTPATPCTESVE